jgi:hypothetical protein
MDICPCNKSSFKVEETQRPRGDARELVRRFLRCPQKGKAVLLQRCSFPIAWRKIPWTQVRAIFPPPFFLLVSSQHLIIAKFS